MDFLGAIPVPLAAAIIAAIIAPLVTWLVAVRRFSGSIKSSESAELWAEARDIRHQAQKRIEFLEERVLLLEKENFELRRKMAEMGIT